MQSLQTSPLISITSGLGLQMIKEEVSESIYLHPSLTQYEEKGTCHIVPETQHIMQREWNKLGDGYDRHRAAEPQWSSPKSVSLTAQWHQVGVGEDLDQTGTGFSYSSPTCSTPEHDCHKILLISSTDLGAPQIAGFFYQKQTTMSFATFSY